MQFKLTTGYINELKELIEATNEKKIRDHLEDLHPADIAEIFGELGPQKSGYLYLLLEDEKAADVLTEMDEDDREKLIHQLPSEELARHISENMDSDDAADVLAELPDQKIEEVLQKMDDVDQAGDIADLLAYHEDTAGGLMAKELIKVNENWDIVECIREMRKQSEEVDELYYVYVVDDDGILKGTVSLKRLIVSRSNAKIKNISNTDVISVRTTTKSVEVAQIMGKYDLVALPVVDQLGRLVGRITIDDVVDVIQEEAEKDYQMMAGITQDVEPTDSPLVQTRARLPWLLIGLVGGILGAQIIGLFEENLRIDPRIALFFPLIAAMAGNVGVQSSSIVVQGLASGTIDLDSIMKKLLRELLVAIINGSILALLLFGYNYFFSDSMVLTMTVSVALFSVIMFASVFGTFVPLLLNRYKIDPALATGPFVTTINDITGILIYLGIGRVFYAM